MAERWTAAGEHGDERLAAVLTTLERGIEAMLTSDGFAAYLRAMARFPTYSARNIALIYAQRPDASRVLGYRAWQALGRQVRRGERGIRILAPYRRTISRDDGGDVSADERTTAITGFGVATVFDIAQTDGEPLPAPTAPHLLAGDSPVASWLWDRLAAFLADEGVPLDRRPLARGYGVYFPVRSLRLSVRRARMAPTSSARFAACVARSVGRARWTAARTSGYHRMAVPPGGWLVSATPSYQEAPPYPFTWWVCVRDQESLDKPSRP